MPALIVNLLHMIQSAEVRNCSQGNASLGIDHNDLTQLPLNFPKSSSICSISLCKAHVLDLHVLMLITVYTPYEQLDWNLSLPYSIHRIAPARLPGTCRRMQLSVNDLEEIIDEVSLSLDGPTIPKAEDPSCKIAHQPTFQWSLRSCRRICSSPELLILGTGNCRNKALRTSNNNQTYPILHPFTANAGYIVLQLFTYAPPTSSQSTSPGDPFANCLPTNDPDIPM